MSEDLVVELLFGASAIVLGLAAWGRVQATRLVSIASGACLAVTAWLVQVTDFIG